MLAQFVQKYTEPPNAPLYIYGITVILATAHSFCVGYLSTVQFSLTRRETFHDLVENILHNKELSWICGRLKVKLFLHVNTMNFVVCNGDIVNVNSTTYNTLQSSHGVSVVNGEDGIAWDIPDIFTDLGHEVFATNRVRLIGKKTLKNPNQLS